MKSIKKICVFLAAIFVFSSVLCCTAFATAGETGYVVDTDVVYAQLPDDYTLDFVNNYYYFSDDEYNSIVVEAIENTAAPDGITALTQAQIQELFFDVYVIEGDESYAEYYDIELSSAKKTKVNGLSAYEITGKYMDTESEDETSEDVYVYPFCSYIFATKENIIMVTYEEVEDLVIDKEDLDFVLATLAVNGTYFEGDAPTVTHDFSNAPAYKDAVMQAEEDGYTYDNEISDLSEMINEETIAITKVVLVIIFIVPFAIIVLVAVIMIIKYAVNKKKLNEYEKKYGYLDNYNMQQNTGAYNYNAGAANASGYVPYVQNPVQQNPATPYGQTPVQQNPVTPNVQNGASNMMPEMNNGDITKTGSYPATENQVPVQPENEE